MENRRLVTILYLVAGLAGGVLVSSAATQVVAYQDLANPVVGIFPITTLLGFVGGALTFGALWRHERATEFVDSAIGEMKKVTWPTREETVNNTGIVVGAAVGFGALMFAYDTTWSFITKLALYSNVGN
ncbi:MAG: preprotein translocase subunit SecE [Deltaproteobacteria bacterium]|nr:preprotein translocase subunit SecE [Deltaproteobacteria bacterium]